MLSDQKLINFNWKLGVHCSTTATLNLLSYYGFNLDEDIIFGIGKGIGFIYFKYPDIPYPYISGRNANLISNALRNLGFIPQMVGGSLENQFSKVIERVRNNVPTIIVMDMNALNYIIDNLKIGDYFPFSEHHALVVGYDSNQDLYIQDHLWPVQKLDYNTLKKTWRAENTKPYSLYHYFYEDNVYPTVFSINSLKQIIISSIYYNAHEFLYPYNPVNNFSGIKGLEEFYKDIKKLGSIYSDDLHILTYLRMIYFPLEKIGTGGGNFRRIYGRFLIKCASMLGYKDLGKIGHEYLQLSTGWKRFINLVHFMIINKQTKIKPKDLVFLYEILCIEKELIYKLYKAVS